MIGPTSPTFQTEHLADEYTYLAPDGSQIRLLAKVRVAACATVRFRQARCLKATAHRTVEELWYCISGKGAGLAQTGGFGGGGGCRSGGQPVDPNWHHLSVPKHG